MNGLSARYFPSAFLSVWGEFQTNYGCKKSEFLKRWINDMTLAS